MNVARPSNHRHVFLCSANSVIGIIGGYLIAKHVWSDDPRTSRVDQDSSSFRNKSPLDQDLVENLAKLEQGQDVGSEEVRRALVKLRSRLALATTEGKRKDAIDAYRNETRGDSSMVPTTTPGNAG